MFDFTDEKLQQLKAINTVREVESQPKMWRKALENYKNEKNSINTFLKKLNDEHGRIKVIFTGAGTSAYVGDTLFPYLNNLQDNKFVFETIATTNIVSNPKQYLLNVPTLLVSFARSGNSPESVAAVNLANQLVDNIYHLAITCAPDGKLAMDLKDKDNAYVLLMPEGTNDKGFAMTSSFSSMFLSALMVFDKAHSDEEKSNLIEKISKLSEDIVNRETEISKYLEKNFDRIVYLGSGSLAALTREAQLKILELTAGKIATCFDSSMGFRHGPKSFVNENTLVFDFVSTDFYTRQYDVDIINEIHGDKIAKNIIAITNDKLDADFEQFVLNSDEKLPDVYLAMPYIVVAQTVAVMTSLKVKNTPDTPSATGTVNRVVKGVTIHNLD